MEADAKVHSVRLAHGPHRADSNWVMRRRQSCYAEGLQLHSGDGCVRRDQDWQTVSLPVLVPSWLR